MKKMIFVTNSFPFSIQESSFIRPEIKELVKEFDITIVSRNLTAEQTTELPNSVKVIRYDSKKNYNAILLALKTVFSSALYKEIVRLIREKRLSVNRIKKAIKYYMRALHFAQFLKPIRNEIDANVVLYTYWNDFSVMSLSMIKKDGDKLVSRAHGADLYERSENKFYLPMKSIANNKTDLIAFISEQGMKYFEKKYPTKAKKEIYRLGAGEQTKLKKVEDSTLSLYSFSYITPVKRLELIPQTLSKIDNININWTHIGSGVLENEVKQISHSLLDNKENITYSFTGAMENKDALEFISKSSFDALINVSESEGLPVTMMEAMSFGIPVIAGNVGGISEIVRDGYNGLLIKSDNNICESLKDKLEHFYKMSIDEKNALRDNAYSTWKEIYNSQKNEQEFTQRIKNL